MKKLACVMVLVALFSLTSCSEDKEPTGNFSGNWRGSVTQDSSYETRSIEFFLSYSSPTVLQGTVSLYDSLFYTIEAQTRNNDTEFSGRVFSRQDNSGHISIVGYLGTNRIYGTLTFMEGWSQRSGVINYNAQKMTLSNSNNTILKP